VGFALALVALSSLVAASREGVVYDKYGTKVTLQQSKEGAEDLQIVLKKGGRPLQHAVFIYAPGEEGWLYLCNGSHRRTVPLGRFTAEGQRRTSLPGGTGKDYITDDVAVVERASTVDVVLTSIPRLYVATERGQHIASLDFGLPIVVRLSASTSSAAVIYVLTRGL
jgi:hypothetical protein